MIISAFCNVGPAYRSLQIPLASIATIALGRNREFAKARMVETDSARHSHKQPDGGYDGADGEEGQANAGAEIRFIPIRPAAGCKRRRDTAGRA